MALQWNLDLTKCQGTGEICSLHPKPQFSEFLGKQENVRYIEIHR